MTVRRVAVVTLLAAMVLTGAACGGSDSGVSSAAAAPLQLRVVAIRDAAAAGDRDTAETQLAELRADVVRFRADDQLDDAAVARILNAADTVKANLSLLVPATSPTTTPESTTTVDTTTTVESTTTSSSTTTTSPDPPGKGKGKGKGGEDD